jgi:hypothetical protein
MASSPNGDDDDDYEVKLIDRHKFERVNGEREKCELISKGNDLVRRML